MRELRATLVYILFGVHFCDDYHSESDPRAIPPYWDRAFSPVSPGRQGEVLSDLALFDPALEAHPQIDRRLVSKIDDDSHPIVPRYPDLPIASARRRAYFEWTPDQIQQIAGDPKALGLARKRRRCAPRARTRARRASAPLPWIGFGKQFTRPRRHL